MKLLYFLTALFVLASCGGGKEAKPEERESESPNSIVLSEEQMKNAGIVVDSIGYRNVKTELKVNGLVDVPPQNIVSVSFPLGGYLKNTKLLPGMRVTRGEVIGLMEDPALVELQQDYLVAQARLEFLQKDLQRQKLLNENKVSADKVLQQVEADYKAQQVLVRGFAEKLRLIGLQPEKLSAESISRSVPVRSPINGFVSKVNVNIGKYVNPSDVLFELINPDDLHAALTVFEKDLALVRPKQTVMVTFVDEPDREYECEVLLVTRNVDGDRSALVHCHFEKQPDRLLPGMFINARIIVDQASTLAVPSEAIVRFENQHYVLKQEAGNNFSLLQVEPGVEDNGFTAVRPTGDVAAGLRIITKNPYPVLAMMMGGEEEH